MMISPSENDYIDIHTHSPGMEKGTFRILNVDIHDSSAMLHGRPVSLGLHPWFINKVSEDVLDEVLEKSAHLSQVIAIGETGLDRLCQIPLGLQEKVFIKHIRFAQRAGKPLIIHAVRTYSEIIRLKKIYGKDNSWIIHGYNGSVHIARNLVASGFYLSLGSRILQDEKKSHELACDISPESIFIETDEDKIHIKTMYDKIADLYNIETSFLRKIIRENYVRAFING